MAKTATRSIRIEPKAKIRAEKIFAKLGISLSEAVSLFFRQCIIDRARPFQPRAERPEIPDDETVAALREIEQAIADERKGKRRSSKFNSAKELFADLEN